MCITAKWSCRCPLWVKSGHSGYFGSTLTCCSTTTSTLEGIIIAAPIWHDWAKQMVFQWNEDGTEFIELNFGGNGKTDNFGRPGDSKTAGHHIIGIAETMARKLSPAFVVTQTSAHAAPTAGNEFKVVNWIRAAALLPASIRLQPAISSRTRTGNCACRCYDSRARSIFRV